MEAFFFHIKKTSWMPWWVVIMFRSLFEWRFRSVITVQNHVSSSSSSLQSIQVLGSSLLTLLWADHHLGNKVDDGACWLLRVVLREQVTHIVSGSAGLPRHKAKDPREAEQST